MATGDPWCAIHGQTPCSCHDPIRSTRGWIPDKAVCTCCPIHKPDHIVDANKMVPPLTGKILALRTDTRTAICAHSWPRLTKCVDALFLELDDLQARYSSLSQYGRPSDHERIAELEKELAEYRNNEGCLGCDVREELGMRNAWLHDCALGFLENPTGETRDELKRALKRDFEIAASGEQIRKARDAREAKHGN